MRMCLIGRPRGSQICLPECFCPVQLTLHSEKHFASQEEPMAKKAKKRVVKKAARRQQVILPTKLSSLIKIALRDMRKAEAKPKEFVIEMSEWFHREEVECRTRESTLVETHEVCVMCAAGSVMAFSLGVLKHKNIDEAQPHHYPKNEAQLNAINLLREGCVGDAYSTIRENDPSLTEAQELKYEEMYDLAAGFDCEPPEYDRGDPEPFHREMEKLQKRLEKAGL
jgi:hypothetical protein